MPREFGERRNPSWDALRTLTLNGQQITESSIGGGGLGNQIIVWRADGSPLGFFDPDAAGFTAALASCGWHDTLQIPSVEITLTAGITLASGMALIGRGENSILSFAGFNGTAITMATWAIIWNLGIDYVSNGANALAIDGRFSSVVIAPCFVHTSGGSATNIGVKYGA